MNYYEVLRVSSTASLIEIKRAYKALVKKYHPDIYEGNKLFAERKIKEINEAYEVLKEKESKNEYDAKLHNKKYEYTKESFVKTTTQEEIKKYSKIYNETFGKKININLPKLGLYDKAKKVFFKLDAIFEKDDKQNFIIIFLTLLTITFGFEIYKILF